MKRFFWNKCPGGIGQVAAGDEKREARLEQKSQEARAKFAGLTDEELDESMWGFIRYRQRWDRVYFFASIYIWALLALVITACGWSYESTLVIIVAGYVFYIIGTIAMSVSEQRTLSEYELERERRFTEAHGISPKEIYDLWMDKRA